MSALSYASYAQMQANPNLNIIIIKNASRIADPNSPRYASDQTRAASLMHHITSSLRDGDRAKRAATWAELRSYAKKASVNIQEHTRLQKEETYRISSILQASTTDLNPDQLAASTRAVILREQMKEEIPSSIPPSDHATILATLTRTAVENASGRQVPDNDTVATGNIGKTIEDLKKTPAWSEYARTVGYLYESTEQAAPDFMNAGHQSVSYDETKFGAAHISAHDTLIESQASTPAPEPVSREREQRDGEPDLNTGPALTHQQRSILVRRLLDEPMNEVIDYRNQETISFLLHAISEQKEMARFIPEGTTPEDRQAVINGVTGHALSVAGSDGPVVPAELPFPIGDLRFHEAAANYTAAVGKVYESTEKLNESHVIQPETRIPPAEEATPLTPDERAQLTMSILHQSSLLSERTKNPDIAVETPYSKEEEHLHNTAVRNQIRILDTVSEHLPDERQRTHFLHWANRQALAHDPANPEPDSVPPWLKSETNARLVTDLVKSDAFTEYSNALTGLAARGRDPTAIARASTGNPLDNAIIVMDTRAQAMVAEAWIAWAANAGPQLPEPATVQVIAQGITQQLSRPVTEITHNTRRLPVPPEKVADPIYQLARRDHSKLEIATTINSALNLLAAARPPELDATEFEKRATSRLIDASTGAATTPKDNVDRIIDSHPASNIVRRALPALIDNMAGPSASAGSPKPEEIASELARTRSTVPFAPLPPAPELKAPEHAALRTNAMIARQATRVAIQRAVADPRAATLMLNTIDRHVFFGTPATNELAPDTRKIAESRPAEVYKANITAMTAEGYSQNDIKALIGADAAELIRNNRDQRMQAAIAARITPLDERGNYHATFTSARQRTIRNPILGPESTGLRFPITAIEGARFLKRTDHIEDTITRTAISNEAVREHNRDLTRKNAGKPGTVTGYKAPESIAIGFDPRSKSYQAVLEAASRAGMEQIFVTAMHKQSTLRHETDQGRNNITDRANTLTVSIPPSNGQPERSLDLYSPEGQAHARGKLLVVRADTADNANRDATSMQIWQAIASISNRFEAHGLSSSDFTTSQNVRRFTEAGKPVRAFDTQGKEINPVDAYRTAVIGAPTTNEQATRIQQDLLDASSTSRLTRLVIARISGQDKVEKAIKPFNTLGEIIDFANTSITDIAGMPPADRKAAKDIVDALGPGRAVLQDPVKIQRVIQDSYDQLHEANRSGATISVNSAHARALGSPVITFGADHKAPAVTILGQNDLNDPANAKTIDDLVKGVSRAGLGIRTADENGVSNEVIHAAIRHRVPLTVYSNEPPETFAQKLNTGHDRHDLLREAIQNGNATVVTPNTFNATPIHNNRATLLKALTRKTTGIILAGASKDDLSTLVAAEAASERRVPLSVTAPPAIFTENERRLLEQSEKEQKFARAKYELVKARIETLSGVGPEKTWRAPDAESDLKNGQKLTASLGQKLGEDLKTASAGLAETTRRHRDIVKTIEKKWTSQGISPVARYDGNIALTRPNTTISAVTLRSGLVSEPLGVGIVGPDGRFEKQPPNPNGGAVVASTKTIRTVTNKTPATVINSEENAHAFARSSLARIKQLVSAEQIDSRQENRRTATSIER